MGVGCFDWSLGMSVRHVYGSNEFGRFGLFIGPGALSPQIAPPRGIFVSWGRGWFEYTGYVGRGWVS